MDAQRLQQQLAFIVEVDQLKAVLRRSYLMDGSRRENSGEHSWHIALAAAILAEYSDEPIDLHRVIKILLAHDIVEIDAGDTFAYDVPGHVDKDEREQRAADRLFGMLPADQSREFRALWDEFEALITPEARFARAIDMMMPLLHNYHNGGMAWREFGVTSDRVFSRAQQIGAASTDLWEQIQVVIHLAVEKGYLRK